MKKRDQQKLAAISAMMLVLFNAPFMLSYNMHQAVAGVPVTYLVIFLLWLFSAILSYIILKRKYE